MEAPVRLAADLVIDHGRTRYDHPQGFGSTIIELGTLKPIRRGILFDRIADIGIDLRTAA